MVMEKIIEFEDESDVPAGFSFQQLPEGVKVLMVIDSQSALVDATEAGIAELGKIPRIIVRDQGYAEAYDDL